MLVTVKLANGREVVLDKASAQFKALQAMQYEGSSDAHSITTQDGTRVTLRNGDLHRWVDDKELQSIIDTGRLSPTPANQSLSAAGGYYGRPGHKDFDQSSEGGKIFIEDLQGSSTYQGSGQHHLILNVDDIPAGIKVTTDKRTVGSVSLDGSVPMKNLSLVESKNSKIFPGESIDWKKAQFDQLPPGPPTGPPEFDTFGDGQSLLKLYQEAERQLIAVIQASPRSPFTTIRIKQQQAINQIIQRMTAASGKYAETTIPDIMKKADSDTLKRIAALNEPAFNFDFFGVNEDAIRVFTGQVYLDFAKTIQGVKNSAERAVLDKAAIQNDIIISNIRGESFAKTGDTVVQDLKQQGFVALRSNSGRNYYLEPYSNMVVRTQGMAAYNYGSATRLIATGRKFGYIPTIPPQNRKPNDPCWELEKKRFVDLEKDPLPPGATHPHCRHPVLPASFAMLKAERPDLYEQAIGFFSEKAGFDPT